MYAIDKPLMNKEAILKGFLSGTLFAGFFILEGSVIIKSIVFIYGFLVILDDLLPSREINDYPILSLICLVIGFVLAFPIAGIFGLYMPIIILATTVLYIIKIKKAYATRV